MTSVWSDGSIVQHLCNEAFLLSDSSILRQHKTPRTLYFDSSTVWQLCSPTSLYSDKFIFRQLYSAKAVQLLRMLKLNVLDTLTAYINIFDQIQVFFALNYLFALRGLATMGFVNSFVNRAMGF